VIDQNLKLGSGLMTDESEFFKNEMKFRFRCKIKFRSKPKFLDMILHYSELRRTKYLTFCTNFEMLLTSLLLTEILKILTIPN